MKRNEWWWCSRGVNNHSHASVTMADLSTVEPDGVRVRDGDDPDAGILAAAGVEEPAPDAAGGRGAGGVEGGLRDGVAAWVELEDHRVAHRGLDGVGYEDEAVFAQFDDVLGREGGWEEEEKKGGEDVHLATG